MIRTRMSAWVLAAAVLAVCLASAHQPVSAQQAQQGQPLRGVGVAISVNDQVVSTYDIEQRMMFIFGQSGIRPTQENIPEVRQQATLMLIDERLKLQEAKSKAEQFKIDLLPTDKEVDEEIAYVAQRNQMSPQDYARLLASWGVDFRTERDRIRADTAWRNWISAYYSRQSRVGQGQIDTLIASKAAEAAQPSYQIAEIYLEAAKRGGMDQALQLANQLIEQLRQNARFQSVAASFSDSATAANGGEVGWVVASDLPPEVVRVLDETRPGQLTAPIQTRDGVYLVYLVEKRSGGGSPVVNLKQAAMRVPPDAAAQEVESARQKLAAVKSRITGCSTVETASQGVDGVAAGDLGEAETKDLSPAFREAAERLQINQASDPIRTEVGMHVIVLCGKRDSAAPVPTREEIEYQLRSERLNMFAQRELRKLKAAATIEAR